MNTKYIDTGNTSRLSELAEAPIGRLLLRYSIPAVVGIMVMQLYNIVDRAFIGQVVGADAIAGLAITFPVMNISAALGVLIGGGASSRISITLGGNDEKSARMIAGNSLTLTLAIGLAYIGAFALFVDDVLRLFGATEETLPYARDMMLWVLPGLLLTNVTFSFNNIMRASGFPRKAMVTMFIGAAVNVVLDPIFIYWLGWGIKGAAIATDIAMAVSAWFVIAHFVKPHGVVHFRKGTYSLRWPVVKGIIAIGAAPSIVNVASCLINILINNSLNHYGGSSAIAAAGVFVTVTAFICSIILGICQGMQPIVGFNYGAGKINRLSKTLYLSITVSTIVCSLGWLASMTIPQHLSRVFLNDPALIEKTAHYLRISMTLFWMVGFQIVATVFFQSIGKAGKSIFLSLTRQVIFIIPLLIVLPRHFGLDGIWASFPTSDAFATIVTLILLILQIRSLRKDSLNDYRSESK